MEELELSERPSNNSDSQSESTSTIFESPFFNSPPENLSYLHELDYSNIYDIEVKDVVFLNHKKGPIKMNLYLSNIRILLITQDGNPEIANSIIPLGAISRIEKKEKTNHNIIKIRCKDFRDVHLQYKRNEYDSIIDKISQSSFTLTYQKAFIAFKFNENSGVRGWLLYDAKQEYQRMGIPNESWIITEINENYRYCETYPSVLAVPNNCDLESIKDFRDKGRIPVLSWIHPINKNSLTRSGQPRNRIITDSKALQNDANYLNQIAQSSPVNRGRILIMDARSKEDAFAYMLKGGGYENSSKYINSKTKFLSLPTIGTIRESLNKFRNICCNSDVGIYNIKPFEWYKHVNKFLAKAQIIARYIEIEKYSVLVHCSHGWDQTPILTSLTMILLDPFYRTIEGFEILIEKEWLSFGHQFAKRIGHGNEEYITKERSPVFLLFIDCVWQILINYPSYFEFNQTLLIVILDHLYSCIYGTFLYNSEAERKLNRVKENTRSLWSLISFKKHLLINSAFRNPENSLFSLFVVNECKFWFSYYQRWLYI